MSKLRRLTATVVALSLLAAPALPTWSICVVNVRTGEACVAVATCLESTNLRKVVPVMRPGLGCGASQSAIDLSGAARLAIYDGLGAGLAPQDILTQLLAQPGVQSRQYGIVDFEHAPVTFTGAFAAAATPSVAGVVGDLKYAIQGNILAGLAPVFEAEAALVTTGGDLSQKVMAAMEAARAWGGDGRCSCNPNAPTACGTPPPAPFKSAHVACMLLSRIGDTGGGMCNSTVGCATGQFYLTINIVGTAADPDPVLWLQQDYATWRAGLAGRPDHILTRVLCDADRLVADGKSKASVTVRLCDIDGVPLTSGGQTLTLTNLSAGPSVTTPSAIVDHGDGSFSFTFCAGMHVGADRWRIVVNDGVGNVTLHPDLELRVDPVVRLSVGKHEFSLARDEQALLVVNCGASFIRRPYLLLASNAGTLPGVPFAGTQLLLNPSRLLNFTYTNANSVWLPGTSGKLDRNGRAEARFAPDPNLLMELVGTRVDWSCVVSAPFGSRALAPVGFDVVP